MIQADRSGMLEVDGCTLEFEWQGPQPSVSAPALVFLHEGLGCVRMWRDFPEQLAAATGLSALNYSRAGYGNSGPADLPRQPDYMHHEALVVLPKLLDAFAINSAILVGHSDGGSIAIIHTGSESNDRIKGLALLAPHVFVEPLSVKSIAQAAELYRTTELSNKLSRYHGSSVSETFWGWNDIWLHEDFFHWNIEQYLPAITAPILLLQGRDDQYGTVAQLEAIESQVAGRVQRHMLDDCAHSPHQDQPAAVLAACTAFLDTLVA